MHPLDLAREEALEFVKTYRPPPEVAIELSEIPLEERRRQGLPLE